jgi:hypothetical protein
MPSYNSNEKLGLQLVKSKLIVQLERPQVWTHLESAVPVR